MALDKRPSAAKRGYGARWQKVSKAYLLAHPNCVRCGKAAQVVDHIVPHKGDWLLLWNPENYQALCAVCHNVKTSTTDGGFGRKAR